MSMRTLVVWCPDWPVIAAEIVDGCSASEPVVVLHANRVLASSAAARAEGIRRGLRKREAQGRCPDLVVIEHDPGRDARAFEPVVAAVEELAPGVETLRPGVCALAARGPARYFGGEEGAAERIVEHVAQRCGVEAQVGIAEGTFAAGLAARAGRIVPPGETPAFLAGLDIAALGRPPLVDLLRRLGIRTLGEFAALPAADVLARFGFDAALAHRLAGGQDGHPLAAASAAARPRRDRGLRRAARPGRRGRVRRPGARRAAARPSSPGTGWPAPGWSSRRSPNGRGTAPHLAPRRAAERRPRSPTGCAGSWTAG